MKLTIKRETLLKPLQMLTGVIERRQTMAVLANVLFELKGEELFLTGTDLEVELRARVLVEQCLETGAVTVPAKKLLEICRALPDQAELELAYQDTKLTVRSGRSRFSLQILPASEFPNSKENLGDLEFSLEQKELRTLIENTQFAMAQQDVRYYLNGMLLEIADRSLHAVATDGHRLAYCSVLDQEMPVTTQIIVPRKAIMELTRLLDDDTGKADLTISATQLRLKTTDYTFTTKLIDGRYPDYHKVIPKGGDKVLLLDRDSLRQSLSRVAVLSSEKHRGVQLELLKGTLRISANNPEQEEAEEELSIVYDGENLVAGFNVTYLLDALNALPAGTVKLTLGDSSSSLCIGLADRSDRIYVVMPMRL